MGGGGGGGQKCGGCKENLDPRISWESVLH